MKKKTVLFFVGFLALVGILIGTYFLIQYVRVKYAKIEVTLVDDLTIEFLEQKKVSDLIARMNGTLVKDQVIDTKRLGSQEIKFEFINDDHIKVHSKMVVEVVDRVAPVIWLGSSYRVKKGSDIDLAQAILCGDNQDPRPSCVVEGSYDVNEVGSYSLVYQATDQSGNQTVQPFTLQVYEPTFSSGVPVTPTYTLFSDVVKTHKNEHTKIGIDVSSWQGDIDFAALKASGVEFMMIRVGGTIGTNGDYFLDKKFLQNMEQAKEYQIPVGVYFYSYANSSEGAKKDALWVLDQIKDYKLDFPIAFDWEEWADFNQYQLSFFGLTSMAETFLNTVQAKGYQGMLYSSKAYLEDIWLPIDFDIWLAHYTSQTSYQGPYRMWQLCNNGSVPGIKGNVDINVYYEE